MDTLRRRLPLLFLVALLVPGACAARGSWAAQRVAEPQGGAYRIDLLAIPPGVRVIRDTRYGGDPLETFDVYAPSDAREAPVIFMVHGGGWQRGDKTARGVVQNKVVHWVPRGIIVISVDYPLLPQATPLQQARSVAKALAFAQRHAAEWGGDGNKFVLMGHSAGAHLVTLISAEPTLATGQGALPWLGTVALDSAAYDVASII